MPTQLKVRLPRKFAFAFNFSQERKIIDLLRKIIGIYLRGKERVFWGVMEIVKSKYEIRIVLAR